MAQLKYQVESYKGNGWIWEAYSQMDEERLNEYRTNGNGEGLWCNGQQILGTTQFRLSTNRQSVIRKLKGLYNLRTY